MEQLAGDAFRRVGSVRLAVDEAELGAIDREHDALRADGFAVERLDALPDPLDRLYLGAIHHPHDGVLQPARWVRRLAVHAVHAGAEIHEHESVAVDEVDADAVVVAGDGFTASLLGELAPHVVATRGQVLATEPLRHVLYGRPHYARGGYDYWQQLPDGRLIVGGRRDSAFDEEQTDVVETTGLVQRRLDELVHDLVGDRPRITHRWAGIWGTTPDLMPLAGRVLGRDGVWVAGGYSGHGNALGLACGDLVARAILGEEPPELALFDPARFFP
jgi:gamma-glutamylputrescine oxidase